MPIDADRHLYVGIMADPRDGLGALAFRVKYPSTVRWLLHGKFSAQDRWMVDVRDAP